MNLEPKGPRPPVPCVAPVSAEGERTPPVPGGEGSPPSIPGLSGMVPVARGGSGMIYRATHVATGVPVAVKVLSVDATGSASAGGGVWREGGILSSLRQPNIVRLESFGRLQGSPDGSGGAPYLVLEWIDGDTLQRRHGSLALTVREAVRVVRDLARALALVHAAGVVHRDVKPANVLLAPGAGGSVPTLIDFGLARHVRGDGGVRRSNGAVGTPGYMAPEQAAGDGRLGPTPATDIHGLGATLYFLLYGRPPYGGRTTAEAFARSATGSIDWSPPPGRRVPAPLGAILSTCLERHPARRYASAEALADDLDRFLEGRPVRARRVGWPVRAGAALPRSPRSRAALGVAAAASLGLVVVGRWTAEMPGGSGAPATGSIAALAGLTDGAVERIMARGRGAEGANLAYLRRVRDLYRDWTIDGDRHTALSARIEALCRLASIFGTLQAVDDARECYRRARADCDALARTAAAVDQADASRVVVLREESRMLLDVDRAAEAEESLRRALRIASAWKIGVSASRDRVVPAAMGELAVAVSRQGRAEESQRITNDGLLRWVEVRRAWPDDHQVAFDELSSLHVAGAVVAPGATVDLRRARLDVLVARAREAKGRFPAHAREFTRLEVLGLAAGADLQGETGDHEAALATAREIEALALGMRGVDGERDFFRDEAIEAAIRAANATTALGRPDESAVRMDEAVLMARRAVAAEPVVIRHVFRLAKALQARGLLHERAGRPAEAIADLRAIVAALDPWVDTGAARDLIRETAAGAHAEIARLLVALGDPASAVARLRISLDLVPAATRPDRLLFLAHAAHAAGDEATARVGAVAVADDPRYGADARALIDVIDRATGTSADAGG